MENFTLVRPEHLNHHGYLFGGVLLKWVDEFAWMAASRDYPGSTFVTVGMDKVAFRHRVVNGAILRFQILPLERGRTSLTYAVEVFAAPPGSADEQRVFSTRVTFVRIDGEGKKISLSPQNETSSDR
jgi:acyl-CoA hydrolase